MPWVEVMVVFAVSHCVGDYLFQTEWQALHKRGGLSGTPEMRRALISHVFTYTLAFVPSLIWLWDSDRAGVFAVAALIAIPHLIQDDGTLLYEYAKRFKHADIRENPSLGAAVDQSFHVLTLFAIALIAGS